MKNLKNLFELLLMSVARAMEKTVFLLSGSHRYHLSFMIFSAMVTTQPSLADGIGSNSPKISISPSSLSVNETNSDFTRTFTVRIDECPDTLPIKIRYSTRDGSATHGSDYVATSGTYTFQASPNCNKTRTFHVKIRGDTTYEPDETFYIDLHNNGTDKNQQSFTFNPQSSSVTIRNDDPRPENNNADVQVTKTNNVSGRKKIGDIVTYTIVAKNNGPKSTKLYVRDNLPDEVAYVSVSDNKSNFNCSYDSSNHRVICSGSRIFAAGQSVRITLKVRVTYNSYRIRNKVFARSDDSPRKHDNHSGNNRAQSDFYTHSYNLQLSKRVKRSNGQWYSSVVAHTGDTLTFRLVAKNTDAQPTQITLTDTFPSGLSLQNATVSGVSGFSCSTSGNTLTCTGPHKFRNIHSHPSDKATVLVTAKAIQSGEYYNYATAKGESGIRGIDRHSNHVGIDIDHTPGQEYIERSKTVTPPTNPDGNYYIGDTVTFTVKGVTHGLTKFVRILDWLPPRGGGDKYGTTRGAFEYRNLQVGPGAQLNCGFHSNSSHTDQNYVYCTSNTALADGQEFTVYITAKLIRAGEVCNRAHFYKLYERSEGSVWIYKQWAQSCFNVLRPKQPPRLDDHTFTETIDTPVHIDLKDYTTDRDSDKNNDLTYSITSGSLPSGLAMDSHGVITGTYSGSTGNFTFTVTVTDEAGLSDTANITIDFQYASFEAREDSYRIPIGTFLKENMLNNDTGEDLHVTGVDYLSSESNLSNDGFTWSSDGNFTYQAPSQDGTIVYGYRVRDKYDRIKQSKIKIEVYTPEINAKDDSYETGKNSPVYGNVIDDDTGNGSDVGDDLQIVAHTEPQHGTLSYLSPNGKFGYTPDQDYEGQDSFTYTIRDKYGQESNATVTILVAPVYDNGHHDFVLINPPSTRNIIGDYLITGNTIECLTDRSGSLDENESYSYGGRCSNDPMLKNEEHVARYIDVDGNNTEESRKTWNSSTATFTLPESSYLQENGRGILWAGLFWQGSVNNRSFYRQRRAIPNSDGRGYHYKEIRSTSAVNIPHTQTPHVLLRLDDNQTYVPVTADTLYFDNVHKVGSTNAGGYYSAYTNITRLLQDSNLSAGDHNVTVANITTNEGREKFIGNYGGWSLVVIYKENLLHGRPRNISIYNGFVALGGKGIAPEKDVTISGFKLPVSGDVNARLGIFTGEGEKAIGGSPTVYDRVSIIDANGGFHAMPTSEPNNMFDSHLTNISRPHIGENDNDFTNSIDIDSYDVSDIMRSIRDSDTQANRVTLRVESRDTQHQNNKDSDYIVASMLSFSAELYIPTLCYDYSLYMGNYVRIDSKDRQFTAQKIGNVPLLARVMIRSKEADFDLYDTNLYLSFVPDQPTSFRYRPGESMYTPPGTNVYYPATDTNTTLGSIAIGRQPVNGDLSEGGILKPGDTTYAKMNYTMIPNDFNGSFDINLKTSVKLNEYTYLPYLISTAREEGDPGHLGRCPTNIVYNPVWYHFNVERSDSTFTQPGSQRYPLLTQVAGREFNVTIASYSPQSHYTTPAEANTTVEVEIINAGTFENNSSYNFDTVCNDPSSFGKGALVHFNEENRIPFTVSSQTLPYTDKLVLRNAAFRIWALVHDTPRGPQIVDYDCSSPDDDECFSSLYDRVYKGSDDNVTRYCASSCNHTSQNGRCYQCLKEYFSIRMCSRDNFAIRPALLKVSLYNDTNASSVDPSTASLIKDNSNPGDTPLVAGYQYPAVVKAMDFNATSKTTQYFAAFNPSRMDHNATLIYNMPSSKVCAEESNASVSFVMYDGQSSQVRDASGNSTPYIVLMHQNVGNYRFNIVDSSWTEVDQVDSGFQPLFKDANGVLKHHADCRMDAPTFTPHVGKPGCFVDNSVTKSVPWRSSDYVDLNLSFHPDHFSADSLSLTTQPRNDSTSWLYMNDLSRSTKMSVTIDGNVSARGADDTVLSNFTSTCAANDVDLNLTLQQTPAVLRDSNGSTVPLQHRIEMADNPGHPAPATEANATETLGSILFGQNGDSNGSASFKYYINFKKPLNYLVNVADVNFSKIGIYGTSGDLSWAYGSTAATHRPTGSADINATRHFYFAKIITKDSHGILDPNVPRDEINNDHKLKFYVEVYCEDNASGWPDCANLVGLGSLDAGSDFYRASDGTSWEPLNDGKITSIDRNDTTGNHATITPNANILFQADASSSDVTVAYRALRSQRPETVVGVLDPDEWLLYDANRSDGKPSFRIRFIRGLFHWKGEGEVGHVINIPNAGGNNRVGW